MGSFAEVLDRVCRRASAEADIFRSFVDLGSGQGHAVLAAHALFPFRSCVGIELVPEIALEAEAALKQYRRRGFAARAASPCNLSSLFVGGDFLRDYDWSGASVVLANAVTWPSKLLHDVARQALRLRRGAVLLVAIRSLPFGDLAFLEAFD